MLMRGHLEKKQTAIETVAGITRIYNKDTQETMGYNFHDVSGITAISGRGQVKLNQDQLDSLNQRLYEQGFETINLDNDPRLLVAEVLSCEDMANSDHLHITQTAYQADKQTQIVCGAANVHAGMRVIAALPGAVMPDGLVIWPGELRGVTSNGMLCSLYELGLDPAHQQKGIAEVKVDIALGTPFDQLTLEDFVLQVSEEV